MRRVIVLAGLLVLVGCKGSSPSVCEDAYHHRAKVTLDVNHGQNADLIEDATKNEIELCESKHPPKAWLDCYRSVTAGDLAQDQFTFEKKCDQVYLK